MTVTEADRHHLYEALRTTLSPRDADTFMNLMLPTDWSELATKSDLRELRAELKTELAELRGEMKADMATSKADLQRTFGMWLFASQAGVVAAITLIVGLLN